MGAWGLSLVCGLWPAPRGGSQLRLVTVRLDRLIVVLTISDALEVRGHFVPLRQWLHGWLRRLRHECGNVRVKELSGAVKGCIVVLHCVVLRQRHAVLRVAHQRVDHLQSSEHQRLARPPQTTCRERPVNTRNLLLSTG